MIKKTLFIACLFLGLHQASGQQLTLEDCYAAARTYYPLSKQNNLIEKSKEYTVANIQKGYLPQINFTAQATYQSDVTKISLPDNLPFALNIESPSKDQYKFYGEINQSLTDAVFIEPQRKLAASKAEIEKQKLEVDLYQLKERVNQLYFGILLTDGQLKQAGLLIADLQTGIDKVSAAIANGVAYRSNKSELQAELLKAQQQVIELHSMRRAYLDMLGLFIHQTLGDSTVLQTPQNTSVITDINRPELNLFDLQKKSYDIQDKLNTAKTYPHAGVFFQGGYGKPGLNMLKNSFEPYYLLGVRLGWSLSAFYTLKKDRKLLDVSRSAVDMQRDVFLFNTRFTLTQQQADIVKTEKLIATDDTIIQLRTDVKKAAQAQLENGVITANDYLLKANAENQARQSRTLHQIDLLMAEYRYKTTSGN